MSQRDAQFSNAGFTPKTVIKVKHCEKGKIPMLSMAHTDTH